MSPTQIILIAAAVVIGGSVGVYSSLKANAKRHEARKNVEVSSLPSLTLAYVKDWIHVELNQHRGRTASVLMPGLLSEQDRANLEGMIPEDLQENMNRLLIILVRDHQETIKNRVIQFETIEDGLLNELKKTGGILNLQA